MRTFTLPCSVFKVNSVSLKSTLKTKTVYAPRGIELSGFRSISSFKTSSFQEKHVFERETRLCVCSHRDVDNKPIEYSFLPWHCISSEPPVWCMFPPLFLHPYNLDCCKRNIISYLLLPWVIFTWNVYFIVTPTYRPENDHHQIILIEHWVVHHRFFSKQALIKKRYS